MDRTFELKLSNGKVAEWQGATGEDAARRYIDAIRPGSAVVATREPRHGLFFGTPTEGK